MKGILLSFANFHRNFSKNTHYNICTIFSI